MCKIVNVADLQKTSSIFLYQYKRTNISLEAARITQKNYNNNFQKLLKYGSSMATPYGNCCWWF